MKTQYTFFWNGPFSNWYPTRFTYKNIIWENSEQAFMWEKAMTFKDFYIANEIRKTPDPKDVKALGREVKGFDGAKWDEVKYQLMVDINVGKFSQNEKLKAELFANSNFVEASPYDKIWGIGMKAGDAGIEDPKNWKGENLLGKALDETKKILMSK